MNHRIYILLLLTMMAVGTAAAQQATVDGTVYVQSLFKYPEAPDYMEDLSTRADYLMDNFWNDMNFKQKVVSQAALQHAFEVYAAPMRWANKVKVINSVKNLQKKLEKNPTLAIQFMKAAEETFHSPRSEVYIDEVYELFLNGFLSNKKVKADRKKKYIAQLAVMEATAPGRPMPTIALTDSAGQAVEPKFGSEYSVVIFGPASDSNLRQILLRLNTDLSIERLCEAGALGLTYVNTSSPDATGGAVLGALPAFVAGGYAPSASSTFDLRTSPSVYLLDADGTIIDRNMGMDTAFNEIARRKFSAIESK